MCHRWSFVNTFFNTSQHKMAYSILLNKLSLQQCNSKPSVDTMPHTGYNPSLPLKNSKQHPYIHTNIHLDFVSLCTIQPDFLMVFHQKCPHITAQAPNHSPCTQICQINVHSHCTSKCIHLHCRCPIAMQALDTRGK